MKADIGKQGSDNYYLHRRASISVYIANGQNRILDVGCAAGKFGAFLKNNGYASKVVGIEIDRPASEEAAEELDEVFCADLNKISVRDLLCDMEHESFDYIVCADVLEHLINPWQVLTELVEKLSTNGKVIASIPNVRHWTVLAPLLFRGRWEYQDAGIMDRTHLRFFAKGSMLRLFEQAGLDVVEMRPLIGGKWKLVDSLSLRTLNEFLAVQWVIVGVPKNGVLKDNN